MKKLLLLAAVFASAAFAQTSATIQISATFALANLSDVRTYWLSEARQAATLTSAEGSNDTNITVSSIAPFSVGNTILIGKGISGEAPEEEIVTAKDGTTLTVTRGASVSAIVGDPMLATSAHSSGDAVFVLSSPTLFSLIMAEAVTPWVQHAIASVGTNAASIASTTSGSVSTN